MEIGVYTFADTTRDPKTGQLVTAAQRLRDLIEEMELADQVGLPHGQVMHAIELLGTIVAPAVRAAIR